jgi:anaerobic selenocysteine-containing dehydrogenase
MLRGGTEIASDYLQPRIGTDIALLKGLCKAVLEMGAEDGAFLGRHSVGFEAFGPISCALLGRDHQHLRIRKPDIERVAARYAARQSVVFAWGMR